MNEEMFIEHTKIERKTERLAMIVAATLIASYSIELNVEKLSIGGSDVVVKEAYVIRGCMGLILWYLMGVMLRSEFARRWGENAFKNSFSSARDTFYYLYMAMNGSVRVLEFFVIISAYLMSWKDSWKVVDLLLGRLV